MDKCTRNGVRCGHRRPISAEGTPICNYLLDTGQLRHCPVGAECTHFTPVQFKTMDNWNDARNRAFENPEPKTPGGKLRMLRKERREKQRTLSPKIGISLGMISRYETDHSPMNEKAIIEICRYFNVSADWLLGLSKNREQYKITEV